MLAWRWYDKNKVSKYDGCWIHKFLNYYESNVKRYIIQKKKDYIALTWWKYETTASIHLQTVLKSHWVVLFLRTSRRCTWINISLQDDTRNPLTFMHEKNTNHFLLYTKIVHVPRTITYVTRTILHDWFVKDNIVTTVLVCSTRFVNQPW